MWMMFFADRRSMRLGLFALAWWILSILTATAATAVTVTYENGLDLHIPCETSQTSRIVVPHVGTVTDINVVNITHLTPYAGDITYSLTDPSGAVTVLVKGTDGGTGDGLINVSFDDSAANPFPSFQADGACRSNSTYQPTGNLSDFNGLQVNGEWTLTITDLDCVPGGRTDCDCANPNGPVCPRELENWGLELSFDVPPDCDSVAVLNEEIATMEAREACRVLSAGPALSITTDLGLRLTAGESVVLGDGVTVGESAKLTVGTCGLDLCSEGPALDADCSPCVTTICAADALCCNGAWDFICVGRVGTDCGLVCP